MSVTSFHYRALDKSGLKQSGVTAATTETEAYRKLTAMGLVPVRLKPVMPPLLSSRVSGKQLAEFAFQFSVLVSARIPIADGLRSIAEQEGPGRFRTVIEMLATRIEAGESIGSAMSEHRDVFGETFIATIKAAEQSGNLTKALDYLAEMLDRQEELRQQMKSAMTYPAIIVLVLTLAVGFLVGFVIPRFAKIFASRNVELPLLTKVMVYSGEFMQAYWWALGIGLVGAFFLARIAMARPAVQTALDHAMHKVPVIRDILISSGVSRFARVLGLCLSSGINLLDALEMAGKASGRAKLITDIEVVCNQVRSGGRIAAVMEHCKYLPPFARRMIASGDEAAELPRMCAVIAKQFERDSAVRCKRLATIIEPLLVVVVAGVVLVVALSVFLPMWNSMGLMGS